jgi:glycosyltransferase involved in cell wall biosynthesis
LTARIKVLSLIDAMPYDGDSNRVLQLATNIDRERYDFQVATLRPPDPVFDDRYGSIRHLYREANIEILDLGERRGQPFADSGWRRNLRRAKLLLVDVARTVRLVRSGKFDLIDGHPGPPYLCGAIAGVICGVPSVTTTYNVREEWTPRAIWAAFHQFTLAVSGAIVTDSEAVANDVRKWMLRKGHPRILVIPNGPPPPVPVRGDAEVRAQFGLKPREQTRVVSQIATHLPGKGQHLLVDAAPAILAKHPDVTFLLVGFERADHLGYTQTLRDRAAALGVGDRMVIAPYQGHIGDVWQVVDYHVHPTMLDSLPNCVLEGMSLGKPAVVSACAGIPTMVLDGRTGIVIPVNDVPALSAAIIRLLDDAELARTFGAAARERYLSGYTAQMLASRMQTLFETLVARKRNR